MPSHDRRAAARRRAWGRGPIILRFESLEGRQLLATTATALPDLANSALTTPSTIDWGDSFEVDGTVVNQGKAAANASFNIEFYASSTPNIGPDSVSLGEITIPAGLAAGQEAPYQADLTMPTSPIPGAADNQPIYIASRIDPEGAITESNTNNNQGVGMGYDVSSMTITPPQPANLVGSTFAVSPQEAFWGTPITVTAQIQNNAQGDAPATRARITLTPAGVQPGGSSDVTIGYLNVPAIPAWQTVNLSQQIVLPAVEPVLLNGATSFTIAMVQDADFITNDLNPHTATQGQGLDQSQLVIGPNPDTNVTEGALPDLAADGVTENASPIFWGQTIQVSTGVDNVGAGTAGPFDVRFYLTGAGGSLNGALVLGDVQVNGLGSHLHQDINAVLAVPSRLPAGVTIPGVTTARIAMVIDPDNTMDETLKSNNAAESNPVTLRLLGSDGSTSVPTTPADTTPTPTLGTAQTAGTVQKKTTTTAAAAARAAKLAQLKAKRAAALAAAKAKPRKLVRHITPTKTTFIDKVTHRLTIFPKQINNFEQDLFYGKGAGSVDVTKLKRK